MYVCVCNALNDRRVKQAIRDGKCTVSELREYFGFESCCGRCTQCMRGLIEDHHSARALRQSPKSETTYAG